MEFDYAAPTIKSPTTGSTVVPNAKITFDITDICYVGQITVEAYEVQSRLEEVSLGLRDSTDFTEEGNNG